MIEQFILGQLDRPGAGHNTFTPGGVGPSSSAPAKVCCSRTRNPRAGSLIEAVRDQTRIVDLKQVNRVLINPTGEKTGGNPL